MPVADLASVPNGADLFIDANIFIYGFQRTSAQCVRILERCAREDVIGITSLDVVNDVTHRLMLAEALAKGFISKESAAKLKDKPAVVAGLTDYWNYTVRIFSLNVLLLGQDEKLLHSAQHVRSQVGLLTKDSLVVATMDSYAITRIATRDKDFARIDRLAVYQPSDI